MSTIGWAGSTIPGPVSICIWWSWAELRQWSCCPVRHNHMTTFLLRSTPQLLDKSTSHSTAQVVSRDKFYSVLYVLVPRSVAPSGKQCINLQHAWYRAWVWFRFYTTKYQHASFLMPSSKCHLIRREALSQISDKSTIALFLSWNEISI